MGYPVDRLRGASTPVGRQDFSKSGVSPRFSDFIEAARRGALASNAALRQPPMAGGQGAGGPASDAAPVADAEPKDPAKSIADDRRRRIEDWVHGAEDSFWPWNDDAHEKVAQALRGGSDLGPLSDDERRYLVDKALDRWIGEGDAGTSPRELAGDVHGDGGLEALVAERCAVKAADLAADRRGKPAEERNGDATQIARAAIMALRIEPGRTPDAGQQEALRQLVESLDTRRAGWLAEAVSSRGIETDYVAATLDAITAGPQSDSGYAFTTGAFMTLEDRRYFGGNDLSRPMARAMARYFYPYDSEGQRTTAKRLEDLLSSPVGRGLLTPPADGGKDMVGQNARMQALMTIIGNPEITDERLSKDHPDPWTSPLIAQPLAQERADLALQAAMMTPEAVADHMGGGTGIGMPEQLAGLQIDNRVGRAMNLPPDGVDPGMPADELRKVMNAAERGQRSLYTSGDNLDTVSRISSAIRDIGGEPAAITELPIQYSNRMTGPVTLPLFRVEGKDGKPWFVDNQGARYEGFAQWLDKCQLPPGAMTYPKNGELRPGPGGSVVLETRNTPKTVDTPGEYLLQMADMALLVGGAVAGGALSVGSGGLLVPAVAGAAMLWAAGRVGVDSIERMGLGLPPTAGAALTFAAAMMSTVPLGRMLFLLKSGQAATLSGLPKLASYGAVVTDAAATVENTRSMIENWDKMGPGQRFEALFGTALWAGMSAGMARQAVQSRMAARTPQQAGVPDTAEAQPAAAGNVTEMPLGGREPVVEPDRPERATYVSAQHAAREVMKKGGQWVDDSPRSALIVDLRTVDTKTGRAIDSEGREYSASELFQRVLVGQTDKTPIIMMNFKDIAGNGEGAAAAHRFAQQVADMGGTPVLAPSLDGSRSWVTFNRQAEPRGPQGIVEIEDGKLSGKEKLGGSEVPEFYLVDDKGVRQGIKPEDHLGPVLQQGGGEVTFAFGDDYVIVAGKDTSSYDTTIPNGYWNLKDRLTYRTALTMGPDFGFPMVPVTREFKLNGLPAVAMKRYPVSDIEAAGARNANGVIYQNTLLTDESLAKFKADLENIRNLLIKKGTGLSDLKLMADKDGSVVIYPPSDMHFVRETTREGKIVDKAREKVLQNNLQDIDGYLEGVQNAMNARKQGGR